MISTFFEVIIAIVIFFGIWSVLGLVGGILGALFVSIIKIVLVAGAIIWAVRLIQRLV